MRNLLAILSVFILISCKNPSDQQIATLIPQKGPLFQIITNGKTGFINNQGTVIIVPQFLGAGNFSEGMAAARIDGTYGYIDATGKFVIQPQFDYATPFSESLAVVYKDGIPFYIDQKGGKAFECTYQLLGTFDHGKAIVKTITGKTGMIDKQGKLFVDTVFADIHPFIQGLSVVEGLKNNPNPDKGQARIYETGAIDSTGRFIIPYGKYERIEDFEDGYFKVDIPANKNDTIEGYSTQTGFANKTGKLIMSKDHKNNTWIAGKMHCGLAKINLYKYWLPEDEGTSYNSGKSYEGFINLKGKIVINNTTFESVTDFSDNRAFVKKDSREFSIINTQGNIISNKVFDRISRQGFVNGSALVSINSLWGIIDTNANFIVKPRFMDIDEVGMVGKYLFFKEDNSGYDDNNKILYGIAKTDGTIVLKAIMQEFDRTGFKDSLLQCTVDNKLVYIHEKGKIIWMQKENPPKQLLDVNIDFMNRGYFYANSERDEYAPGGYGQSGNDARTISDKENFASNAFSVIVQPGTNDTFKNFYKGAKVYIVNKTLSSIKFKASDSRLYMKVQALDIKGEWRDIEYLPSSWCGNSYHTLTLNPNNYWSFTTPKYKGDLKTKLRIALQYIDPNDDSKQWPGKQLTVYSNEYEGSVNPGQFWRKRDYYPTNLMDPYNE